MGADQGWVSIGPHLKLKHAQVCALSGKRAKVVCPTSLKPLGVAEQGRTKSPQISQLLAAVVPLGHSGQLSTAQRGRKL